MLRYCTLGPVNMILFPRLRNWLLRFCNRLCYWKSDSGEGSLLFLARLLLLFWNSRGQVKLSFILIWVKVWQKSRKICPLLPLRFQIFGGFVYFVLIINSLEEHFLCPLSNAVRNDHRFCFLRSSCLARHRKATFLNTLSFCSWQHAPYATLCVSGDKGLTLGRQLASGKSAHIHLFD